MSNTTQIRYKYSSADSYSSDDITMMNSPEGIKNSLQKGSAKTYPRTHDDSHIQTTKWMNKDPDTIEKSSEQIKKALHNYITVSTTALQNNESPLQDIGLKSTINNDISFTLNEWLDSCERSEKIKDTPVNFSYNAISSAFMYEIAKRISDEKHSKTSSINDSLDEIKKHLCDYELNIDIREPIHFKDCSSDDNLIAIACEVLMLFKNSTKW